MIILTIYIYTVIISFLVMNITLYIGRRFDGVVSSSEMKNLGPLKEHLQFSGMSLIPLFNIFLTLVMPTYCTWIFFLEPMFEKMSIKTSIKNYLYNFAQKINNLLVSSNNKDEVKPVSAEDLFEEEKIAETIETPEDLLSITMTEEEPEETLEDLFSIAFKAGVSKEKQSTKEEVIKDLKEEIDKKPTKTNKFDLLDL
jgi:hypothetical protein